VARERLSEPEYDPTVHLYVQAWHDLGSCRQIGMAAGPIPFTAVLDWTSFRGWDQEATQLLWRVVRHLDSERAEKLENERTVEEMRSKAKNR
jgi:hypothetical protein